jgi:nucleotide-binding universal stress UspA family protein
MVARDLVLCAIDFTPESDEAARRSDDWARSSGASLLFCHLVEDAIAYNTLFPQENAIQVLDLVGVERRISEGISARMHELTGRSEDDFEVLVDNGPAGTGIIARARRLAASLIALGAHAAESPRDLLLGETISYVIRRSPVQVLIARPRRPSGNVVFWSGDPASEAAAIRLAAARARAGGGKLTVVHHRSGDQHASDAERALAEAGIDADVRTTRIDYDTELAVVVEELAVDLVAVAVAAQPELDKGPTRSDAVAIAHISPCSVLVIPNGGGNDGARASG